MAYITANTGAQAAELSFFDRMAALFADMRTWRSHRLAEAQLRALSDHELDDLGIVRADIANVVRHGR